VKKDTCLIKAHSPTSITTEQCTSDV